MAEEAISSTSFSNHMLDRITKKLEDPILNLRDPIAATASLTGLAYKTIQEIADDNKKFEFKLLERAAVLNKLMDFYLKKKTIPTTHQLFLALNDSEEIPSYMNISTFREHLIDMDFVFKKVKSGVVVIEKPVERFERYNFMRKIQTLRASHTIYFVDGLALDNYGNLYDVSVPDSEVCGCHDTNSNSRLTQCMDNSAIEKKHLVSRLLYVIDQSGLVIFTDIGKHFDSDILLKWLENTVQPVLTNPIVFVLPDINSYNAKILETPTVHSLRSAIVAWLEYHKVPYSNDMSKYELLDIAAKTTDLSNQYYKIDEVLKCEGHIVLRAPKSAQAMMQTAQFTKAISDRLRTVFKGCKIELTKCNIDKLINYVKFIMPQIGLENCKKFDKIAATTEEKLIADENALDAIYDELMENAVSTPASYVDSDVPS